MMFATAVLLALSQGAKATDYYPLNEGDEYSYEDTISRRTYAMVMRTGKPIQDKGVDVYPVLAETGTPEPAVLYYVAEGDEVRRHMTYEVPDKNPDGSFKFKDDLMVKKKEVTTYPVFKLTDREAKWAHVGRIQLEYDMTSLNLSGSSRYLGKQRVLGEARDAIEVTLRMTGGLGEGPPVDSLSVSRYAKGVGLYWMKETNSFGKRKLERVRKLIAYTPKKVG